VSEDEGGVSGAMPWYIFIEIVIEKFPLNKTIGLRFELPTELPRNLKFAFHLSGRFYSIGECYAKLDNYLPEKLNGKFEGISSLKEYFRAVNTWPF